MCRVGKSGCCIFQPAFGCCPLQTLVEIVIFSVYAAKNLKKQEFCSKIQEKKQRKNIAKHQTGPINTVLFSKETILKL